MTTLQAALNVAIYQLAVSLNLATTSTQWWSTVRAVAAESNVSIEEAGHILIATAMDMEAAQIEEGSQLCPDCGAFLVGEQMDLDEEDVLACSQDCGYTEDNYDEWVDKARRVTAETNAHLAAPRPFRYLDY